MRLCVEVTLTFTNHASTSAHNWVLIQADSDKGDVAAAEMRAGADNQYVLPGDPNVIASTDVILPGETTRVQFTTPGAGTYVCTIPAHDRQMFGKLIVAES